jgi:hypothetical protein
VISIVPLIIVDQSSSLATAGSTCRGGVIRVQANGRNGMGEENRRDEPGEEVKEQAESKSEPQRDLEEDWSQGGQDVEEAQHEEPGSGS